ncbi:MAG: trypsin-like peptidase domain-containing protein [Chloroflexota bacterium]|nr:trypsin-like peptidase domain-containing protein [Chloroflexota bacterium]
MTESPTSSDALYVFETIDTDDSQITNLYTNEYEDQIISLYKTANPSVVNITSVAYVFNRMLGQLPEEGIGSGFVYDTEGHIITNYHVIEGADELIVTLASGEELNATVVGIDETNDIAVLQVDVGEDFPSPLPLADSSQVVVGETVLAIGNPYGLDWTLTTGVVSALGRVIESSQEGKYIAEAIQTDAAINPGNSGGPLLNMDGQVIGITSQIISESGSSSGLGFAISSNIIDRIVTEIIENGYYLHSWLGVETLGLTDYSIAILEEAGMDVSVDSGVLVIGLESGSPAQEAGITSGNQRLRFGPYIIPLGGDIITAINNVQVTSKQDLMVYLETETSIGDTVQLTIIRDGKSQQIDITLTAQPSSSR